MLAYVPLALLTSAFIVICCDPELRDAEPAPGKKLAPADSRTGASLLCAVLSVFA